MEEKVEDLGDLARGALLGGGVLPGEAGNFFSFVYYSFLPSLDLQEKFFWYEQISVPNSPCL